MRQAGRKPGKGPTTKENPKVNRYTRIKKLIFGGFLAEWVTAPSGTAIFVSAVAWKGRQPRLILRHGEAGWTDWIGLLVSVATVREEISFPKNNDAADNLFDQWLAYGVKAS
jgi:hypothetical protein